MTDAEWDVLRSVLPAPGNTGGKGGADPKWDMRLILDAIFYLVRSGISWQALPADFPPYQTVYDWFRKWRQAGTWCQIRTALRDKVRKNDGRDPTPSAAVIDSQTVRAADTVPNATSAYDAGKKTKGRKRHIAVDTLGLLLTVAVTAASVQDRDGARDLLRKLKEGFTTIGLVWADGGYRGKFVDFARDTLNLVIEVVLRTDDTRGFQVLPRRWVVERTFAWLTKHRRLVRDYETLPLPTKP